MLFRWTPADPAYTGWRLYLFRAGSVAGWAGWILLGILAIVLIARYLA